MNDSPISPDREKQTSNESLTENKTAIAPPVADTITLASDRLNDLFLEAEKTARQKATAELERREIENQKLKIQTERLKDENKRLVELHDTRKQYIGRLFWLIVGWLSVVIALVILNATLKNNFALSDAVLIAFITSTTVSVIALFVIVAKWLFPASDEKSEK